jgi:hypothetical protein
MKSEEKDIISDIIIFYIQRIFISDILSDIRIFKISGQHWWQHAGSTVGTSKSMYNGEDLVKPHINNVKFIH